MPIHLRTSPISAQAAHRSLMLASCLALSAAVSGCGGGASAPAPAPTPALTQPGSPQSTLTHTLQPTGIARRSLVTTTTSGDRYEIGAPDGSFMPGGEWELDNPGIEITDANADLYEPQGLDILHKHIETCTGWDMGGCATTEREVDLNEPPRDVRQAWQDGWTGQGVNILIVDDFGAPAYNEFEIDPFSHGYSVLMSAHEIAPGASYYALEPGISGFAGYGEGGVRDANTDLGVSENTMFDVINISFGLIEYCDLDAQSGIPSCNSFSPDEVDRLVANYTRDSRRLLDDLSGKGDLTNTGDAVISYAAGNSRIDAGWRIDTLTLLENVGERLLIVGALDGYAQDGGANLAWYSDYAGDNPDVQARFLVEYGGSPFVDEVVAWDEDDGSFHVPSFGGPNSMGTSFAAPRVGGHAALLRHKFPNLSGPTTSDIMLDTATYKGLVCHPNCQVEYYGQGRVDIGRALAPIGPLR